MHKRLSVNQICFPGATLAQLLDYWKTLQTQRIGLISPTLLDSDFAPLRSAIERGEFQLETIAHMFLVGQDLSVREATQNGRERLTQLIRTAEQMGARSIYMLTGGHGGLTWEQAAETFAAAIAPCVAQARDAGIALAIENAPMVYADLHIAHSLHDTLTLAEMADIGVCIELFGCWGEADLRGLFERAAPRCALMQLSDYVLGDRALPSRAVPGDGVIPLRQIIEWLLQAGYTGAFDLELIGPRIDREGHLAAARRGANYLDTMLNALGA
jgi:sugar phosphate isomerase/epimerase